MRHWNLYIAVDSADDAAKRASELGGKVIVPQVPPHWMLFFQVADADGLAAKAKGLGGMAHLAPMSMGGVRLSVLADPQGAAFSIIQPPLSR
jgi:predicted enzyme related to lactoylglutathione lyase